MNFIDDEMDLECVYRRTRAGQHELVDPSGRLTDDATHLLARLTGYTDLEHLTDARVATSAAVRSALAELKYLGLAESVDEYAAVGHRDAASRAVTGGMRWRV